MTPDQVLAIFAEADAILHGHFILSSGLHSPVFLQKARVFMDPQKTELLCRALADAIRRRVDPMPHYVVGPAIGGIIPAYETSRQLGVPNAWVERREGAFTLSRFELPARSRIVVVEDIVTTGLSIRETVDCLCAAGHEVVAAACLVDRSAGKAEIGVPLIALAEYEVPAYPADALPPELAAIAAVKPGSRNV